MQSVTSNAVANYTTDTVTSGNMKPVTSNAVSAALQNRCTTTNINTSQTRGILWNRAGEKILTINAFDNSNTGLSVDFDFNTSQIRIYNIVNGVTQGYDTIQ